MKITVLNPFTLDPDEHSKQHVLECKDESLTVQADSEQADINYIVKQFGLTHELPYGRSIPEFADYTNIPNDYQSAREYLQATDELFMSYPAEIRERFDNNPAKLLDFINFEQNREEAIKLGFITPPEMKAEGENREEGKPKGAQDAQ